MFIPSLAINLEESISIILSCATVLLIVARSVAIPTASYLTVYRVSLLSIVPISDLVSKLMFLANMEESSAIIFALAFILF